MAIERLEVAVVVRYNCYEGATPEQCVNLIAWFEDPAAADEEAARLNIVRPNDQVLYFVKILRQRRGESSRVPDLPP